MSTATVSAGVERFLTNALPEVLVLKGAWGVGKTYMWKKLVERFKDDLALDNYCYVSLFGLNSIAELRLAIFVKTIVKAQIGNTKALDAAIDDPKGALYGLGRRLVGLANQLRELPHAKGLSLPVESLASHFISKSVVCLDDFERIGSKLEPEEVLGFISMLKEERGCKVVLIFNEDKLGDKGERVYRRYREKVVDVELLYAPTPTEAAQIALKADTPWFARVRERAIGLNITNIRVLRAIDRTIGLLHGTVKDMHATVLQNVIDAAVLMSWCYYEPDEEIKPPLEFLREYNSFAAGFKQAEMKEKGEKLDPKQEKWMKALDDYGWIHMDEVDESILSVVERGYIEDSGLVKHANKYDQNFKAQDAEQSFSKAWRKFHDTFANNEEELLKEMEEGFKVSVKQVSPLNLNATIRLLRDLKRDDVADRLLDYYMEQRGGEKGLFDPDGYMFHGELKDEKLQKRFAAQHAIHRPLPTLSEAAHVFAKGQGWNAEDMEALDAATPEQFYELFKSDHGLQLQLLVRGCLRLGGVAGHEEVGKRVRSALDKIAAESPINKLRVSRILARRGEG